MAKIKWQEAPYLKCEISLNSLSDPEFKFIYIGDDGNEYEITAPDFSFDVAAGSGVNISRFENEIHRVGGTHIDWGHGRVYGIGDTGISWLYGNLHRIGKTRISWNGDKIVTIGDTSINWHDGRIARVGRASISSNGDISGSVK